MNSKVNFAWISAFNTWQISDSSQLGRSTFERALSYITHTKNTKVIVFPTFTPNIYQTIALRIRLNNSFWAKIQLWLIFSGAASSASSLLITQYTFLKAVTGESQGLITSPLVPSQILIQCNKKKWTVNCSNSTEIKCWLSLGSVRVLGVLTTPSYSSQGVGVLVTAFGKTFVPWREHLEKGCLETVSWS